MTAIELLDEVKLRFHSLLHSEEAALNALLKSALGAYQDRAGVVKKAHIAELDKGDERTFTFAMPPSFLARVACKDSHGNFINVDSNFDDKTIEIAISERPKLPLTLHYFVNLREIDLNKYVLPPSIVGLIMDYLEVLISIPNASRSRRVAIAGNLDVSDIPAEAELYQRRIEIETRMNSSRAAIPMISIQP